VSFGVLVDLPLLAVGLQLFYGLQSCAQQVDLDKADIRFLMFHQRIWQKYPKAAVAPFPGSASLEFDRIFWVRRVWVSLPYVCFT
jgi:hypothetical protein